eukprot:PhF_6_TR33873/c1_g1_i1/m.49709
MPRPFGVWHPATTLAELRARSPSFTDMRFVPIYKLKQETYYSPESMMWFKNPQTFKDHVDRLKSMAYTNKFFGEGFKFSPYMHVKVQGVVGTIALANASFCWYYYNKWIPARNPTFRKIVNKEWEEAMNNSPWDHRTHVWAYSTAHAVHLGHLTDRGGNKKFYIPA